MGMGSERRRGQVTMSCEEIMKMTDRIRRLSHSQLKEWLNERNNTKWARRTEAQKGIKVNGATKMTQQNWTPFFRKCCFVLTRTLLIIIFSHLCFFATDLQIFWSSILDATISLEEWKKTIYLCNDLINPKVFSLSLVKSTFWCLATRNSSYITSWLVPNCRNLKANHECWNKRNIDNKLIEAWKKSK